MSPAGESITRGKLHRLQEEEFLNCIELLNAMETPFIMFQIMNNHHMPESPYSKFHQNSL